MPRACFVALHALPAIDPSVGRGVGGTETRAWMFARGLSVIGDWQVDFIVRQEPGLTPLTRDGINVTGRPDRLYSWYESVGRCVEKSPKFPGLRLRRWEWPLLWRLPTLVACRLFTSRDPRRPDDFFTAMKTDLFVTFGVQANSARVIASALAVGKPAVLMIGSDGDLDERYTPDSDYVSPYGDVAADCHWLITHADAIIVQTEHQKRLLQERFNRDGTVIANPIDLAAWDAADRSLPNDVTGELDRYVLWVGRAESVHKRPQLLIKVAKQCPEVPFLMVLNPRDRAVERSVRGDCPANVRIIEQVPFDLMPGLFARAAAFVSTSALEGFPNVFLQAAASNVPIGSLSVGEEFLANISHARHCGDDLTALAEFVQQTWDAPPTGECGRSYVARHHNLPQQSRLLAEELSRVVTAIS